MPFGTTLVALTRERLQSFMDREAGILNSMKRSADMAWKKGWKDHKGKEYVERGRVYKREGERLETSIGHSKTVKITFSDTNWKSLNFSFLNPWLTSSRTFIFFLSFKSNLKNVQFEGHSFHREHVSWKFDKQFQSNLVRSHTRVSLLLAFHVYTHTNMRAYFYYIYARYGPRQQQVYPNWRFPNL